MVGIRAFVYPTHGHGERAMSGASILTARHHRDVAVLDGGPDTWAAWSGRPLAVGR